MLNLSNNQKIGIFIALLAPILLFFIIKNDDNWKYSLKPLKDGDKIVAFGDSLTYGYQLPREDSYPSLLNQELDYKYNIVNYGVNGNTTIDGLNRYSEMLEKESPQLVILGLGGNDILRRIKPESTKKNLIAMINLSKENGSQVVLLPNPEPSVKGLLFGLKDYHLFDEVSKETNTPVLLNTYSKWLSKDNYKIDKIHLNKTGYYEVAKEISRQLKDNGVVE